MAPADAEGMAPRGRALAGGRGWSAVVGLSTVLTVLVAGQLPTATADDRPAAAPAAAVVVLPASDVLPGAFRRQTLPAPVVPQAVVQTTVQAVVRAAPAKPAAAAAPAAPDRCSGDGWQQRRGQAALASLRAGAERTGFRVEFRGARKGYLGLTHLQERRIEMFVRPCGAQSDELLRHVMAHELGHAYDTTHMTAATRREWQAARGIPAGTPWYGCSGCADFATPAGDYAEVYAQWARGASTNRSQLAGDVPPAQLAALAQRFFGG